MTIHNAALCEAENISVAYGMDKSKLAIKEVSLAVNAGEIVAILGPSGCGKSTLLRSLIGLVKPTSGRVLADGLPLDGINPRVALVFQSFALFPWLTVEENIAVALEGLAIDQEKAQQRIAQCIEVIGLKGFEAAYPKELSGGMKQRVGLPRALARGPKLLCLDEPFSALDIFTAESLRREVYRLVTQSGEPSPGATPDTEVQSVLLITHNIEEAVFLADRVVVMGRNPGYIRQIVPVGLPHPRDYNAPAFQATVQRLREIFVADLLPEEAAAPVSAAPSAMGKLEPLPHISLGQVVGLMEILSAHGGRMDVFELDELTDYEFGQTLGVVKGGEMLDFLDTPKNAVVLTSLGRKLLGDDANGRKAVVNQQLRTLEIFRFVLQILEESPEKRLPKEIVVEELVIRLSSQDPEKLFETVVGWGRYGELFGYELQSETLYLDRPEARAD